MNSINWPAPYVWVFIAQLVEHCSANAEAMGSNPVEAPKTFFGLNLQSQLQWSHHYFICMSAVHILFINYILFYVSTLSSWETKFKLSRACESVTWLKLKRKVKEVNNSINAFINMCTQLGKLEKRHQLSFNLFIFFFIFFFHWEAEYQT